MNKTTFKIYLFSFSFLYHNGLQKILVSSLQGSKYLKIGTCPASQKLLAYMGKNQFLLEISKFSLALQPEALVNMSGRVIFSSPGL